MANYPRARLYKKFSEQGLQSLLLYIAYFPFFQLSVSQLSVSSVFSVRVQLAASIANISSTLVLSPRDSGKVLNAQLGPWLVAM